MVDASRLLDEFDRYLANGRTPGTGRPPTADPAASLPGPVAYFCAEYGIHESMQIYSGGLGILAGDHCKSASDAALPFVGGGAPLPSRLLPPADRCRRSPGARPAGPDPAMLPLRRARGATARRCR